MFAVSVNPSLTNTAVAARLPDAVVVTVLPSEFRSVVSLIHLENVYPPVAVATIEIVSSEAMGITVLAAIAYTAPLIVTATEPVPLMFAVSVEPPVTKNAVATRLPDAVVVTVLPSEFRSAVPLTHLENVLPVAVMDMTSLAAMGITVLTATVYVALFIVTATEPVPLIFAVSVKPPVTKNAVATRLLDAVVDTLLLS